MLHIMLKRQSPSFQRKRSSPSSPSNPPVPQFRRNPNLRCSRQEIQATEGRQEARHLGKNPRSPIAKIHHIHESRWVQQDLVGKIFGESSIKYRNTAASKPKFMRVFDAEVDIICDFNSPASIRVSEIQRPFPTCTLSLSKMHLDNMTHK